MALLAARCKIIRQIHATSPERPEADIISKLVAYTSDQVSLLQTRHQSFQLSWGHRCYCPRFSFSSFCSTWIIRYHHQQVLCWRWSPKNDAGSFRHQSHASSDLTGIRLWVCLRVVLPFARKTDFFILHGAPCPNVCSLMLYI